MLPNPKKTFENVTVEITPGISLQERTPEYI
jgi:hypothetical protein